MGGLLPQAILEEGAGRGRTMLGDPSRRLRAFKPLCRASGSRPARAGGLERHPGLDVARDLEVPVVATNDVHYAERADAEAHLYLSCIKSGRSLQEAKDRHHGASEMYLKSPDEMARPSRRIRGAPIDPRNRGEVPALAQARRADAAQLSRAGGLRHGSLLPACGQRGARQAPE